MITFSFFFYLQFLTAFLTKQSEINQYLSLHSWQRLQSTKFCLGFSFHLKQTKKPLSKVVVIKCIFIFKCTCKTIHFSFFFFPLFFFFLYMELKNLDKGLGLCNHQHNQDTILPNKFFILPLWSQTPLPSLSPWQALSCSLSVWFFFSRMSNKWNHRLCSLFSLASST